MAIWQSWLVPSVEVLLAVLLALAVHRIVIRILQRSAEHGKNALHMALWRLLERPLQAVVVWLAIVLSFGLRRFGPGVQGPVHQGVLWGSMLMMAWLLVAVTAVMEEVVVSRYDTSIKNNLAARKMHTRVGVLRRVLVAMILVVTASALLMTIPAVRTLGASILASAGLIGLIAGLAAQPVLTNLIAGLQIAMTQPIRIDDVVIVNNEWGRIEEIDATYVVVCIWDLRRLIVPLSYFLQQPFENWTYKSADLLGYVHVYADYGVSVAAVRQELERILRASSLWDGNVWNLQVTAADERSIQMRALFSAPDSSQRWDLMVHVRERLIAFLQEHYPEHLPKARVEFAATRPPAVP